MAEESCDLVFVSLADHMRIFSHLKKLVKLLRPADRLKLVSECVCVCVCVYVCGVCLGGRDGSVCVCVT